VGPIESGPDLYVDQFDPSVSGALRENDRSLMLGLFERASRRTFNGV